MATTMTAVATAPTEAALRAFGAREHAACFACRPVAQGGLGLVFALQADGSVRADWLCPAGGVSYAGLVHGGLLATALDGAMVHALFARGIVARTGELTVRYLQPVRTDLATSVTGQLDETYPPLFVLRAEIRQAGVLCARGRAKFVAVASRTVAAEPAGV